MASEYSSVPYPLISRLDSAQLSSTSAPSSLSRPSPVYVPPPLFARATSEGSRVQSSLSSFSDPSPHRFLRDGSMSSPLSSTMSSLDVSTHGLSSYQENSSASSSTSTSPVHGQEEIRGMSSASSFSALGESVVSSSVASQDSDTAPSLPSLLLGGGGDGVWHCSFQCGKVYKKSSGRSIRRHVISCFRTHWPGGQLLKEEEISRLISSQQESGKLTTGLRRWKMRQSRRNADDLSDAERWSCPFHCGKHYRSTSSRSIQLHANRCELRNDGGSDDVDVKGLKTQQDEERRVAKEKAEDMREDSPRVKGEGRGQGSPALPYELPQLDGATDYPHVGASGYNASSSFPSFQGSGPYSSYQPWGGHPTARQSSSSSSSSSSGPVSSGSSELSWPISNSPLEQSLFPLLPSHSSLIQQQLQVQAQLRALLQDIYSRHGLNHPVFQQPGMTGDIVNSLLQRSEGSRGEGRGDRGEVTQMEVSGDMGGWQSSETSQPPFSFPPPPSVPYLPFSSHFTGKTSSSSSILSLGGMGGGGGGGSDGSMDFFSAPTSHSERMSPHFSQSFLSDAASPFPLLLSGRGGGGGSGDMGYGGMSPVPASSGEGSESTMSMNSSASSSSSSFRSREEGMR